MTFLFKSMTTETKKFSTIDDMNDYLEKMVDDGITYQIDSTRSVGDELEVIISLPDNDEWPEDLSACCGARVVNGLCSSCMEHA